MILFIIFAAIITHSFGFRASTTISRPAAHASISPNVVFKLSLVPPQRNPIIPSYLDARDELQVLKERMEKLEKQWADVMSALPEDTQESDFKTALQASYNALTARSIEVSAIVAFFFIGYILGASLFDRLGLVGGSVAAYWASGAVNYDTRSGAIVREVGQKVGRVVVYFQMKWNELVMFYKTGKLAFLGKAQYERLDNRFGIEKKMADFKRLSMMRIAELGQREVLLKDKVADFWAVVLSEVNDPQKQKRRFGLWGTTMRQAAQKSVQVLPKYLPKVKMQIDQPSLSLGSSKQKNPSGKEKGSPRPGLFPDRWG